MERPANQGSGDTPNERRTRVIAVANQKGGVGKSTTAVSLGAALAERGKRVLVVDLDPQGNASTGLGIRHEARAVTVYDVLANEAPIGSAVVSSPFPNLFAIPSTIDLAGAEIELVSQFSRELKLRKALAPVLHEGFDFVFLDCPPSLGLLTINALAAAEELIVPIQCEYYALEGLGQLIKNVRLVQQNVNSSLRLSGIVMTMFDPRTKLSDQVVQEVRRYFGDRVYDAIIPRTVRLSEAPGFGQPITAYDPRSRGAEAYRELAEEVLRSRPSGKAIPAIEAMPPLIEPAAESVRTAPHPLRPGEDMVAVYEAGGEAVDEAGGEVEAGEDSEPAGEGEGGMEPVTIEDGQAGEPSTVGREEEQRPEPSFDGRKGPSPVEAEAGRDENAGAAGITPEAGGEPEPVRRRVVVVEDVEEVEEPEPEEVPDRVEEGGKRRWSLFRRGGK